MQTHALAVRLAGVAFAAALASAAPAPQAATPPLGGLPGAGESPIGEITRGLPDVSLPRSSTGNLPTRYGLGQPVQVGPKTAALFCNLRVVGPNRSDYEDGGDVFVFDNLASLGTAEPTPIARNERVKDSTTGEPRFIVKYPTCVSFWPLEARQPDGSVHPGAGKGVAFCRALSFVGSGDTLPWEFFSKPSVQHYVEVMYLSFDGRQVSVVKRDLIPDDPGWATQDGWHIAAPGLQPAIPDGNDLLLALNAQKEGKAGTGVCRFRFAGGQWQPVAFTRVTGGCEPSLVRRTDGSLVFLTRPSEPMDAKRIMLWTSTDSGATWRLVLDAPNVRPSTPVSVHATPNGRIFVLANALGMTSPDGMARWWHRNRDRLVMWQLAEKAVQLMPPQLIRDCTEEFGAAPDQAMWYCDHPVSATVRLNDGKWHGLLAYRLMAFSTLGEKVAEVPTPQTGCCVEEVPSAQPVTPPWHF